MGKCCFQSCLSICPKGVPIPCCRMLTLSHDALCTTPPPPTTTTRTRYRILTTQCEQGSTRVRFNSRDVRWTRRLGSVDVTGFTWMLQDLHTKQLGLSVSYRESYVCDQYHSITSHTRQGLAAGGGGYLLIQHVFTTTKSDVLKTIKYCIIGSASGFTDR